MRAETRLFSLLLVIFLLPYNRLLKELTPATALGPISEMGIALVLGSAMRRGGSGAQVRSKFGVFEENVLQ